MNFENLKEVIKYLKKTLPCKECGKTFLHKEINTIAAGPTEGIFSLTCNKCGEVTLAEVQITLARNHRAIVTEKDVDEMHEFLEKFDGNFKNLFKSHKK